MKYTVGYFPDKKSVDEYIAQLPAHTKVKRSGRGRKRIVSHDSPPPATDKCVIVEQTLF